MHGKEGVKKTMCTQLHHAIPRFHPETIALYLDLILTQCRVGVRNGEYVRIGEKIEVNSLKELEEALKNMPYKRLQETQRQTYRNSKTISHITCL